MKNEEIVRALRCISTAGGENACEHCPYWKEEEVPEEERPIYGADTWHSCDVDRVGLDGAALIERLTDRCAAYEDTRLTPEEIDMDHEAAEQLRQLCQGCDLDRLEELAEADKDGRLVVLPCKDWLDVVFGDQVLFWGIDKDYVEQPIREISVDDAERIGWYDGYKTVYLKGTDENGEAWEFYPEEIGKTVFLTREESEKALEAMKDE